MAPTTIQGGQLPTHCSYTTLPRNKRRNKHKSHKLHHTQAIISKHSQTQTIDSDGVSQGIDMSAVSLHTMTIISHYLHSLHSLAVAGKRVQECQQLCIGESCQQSSLQRGLRCPSKACEILIHVLFGCKAERVCVGFCDQQEGSDQACR